MGFRSAGCVGFTQLRLFVVYQPWMLLTLLLVCYGSLQSLREAYLRFVTPEPEAEQALRLLRPANVSQVLLLQSLEASKDSLASSTLRWWVDKPCGPSHMHLGDAVLGQDDHNSAPYLRPPSGPCVRSHRGRRGPGLIQQLGQYLFGIQVCAGCPYDVHVRETEDIVVDGGQLQYNEIGEAVGPHKLGFRATWGLDRCLSLSG